jgi:uncharacterized protein YjiK
MSPAPAEVAQLELRSEAKITDLLRAAADARLEASGVVVMEDVLYVIFDNTPRIACVGVDLDPGDAANRLIDQERADDTGYEDIAYDPDSRRLFVLIEALPRGDADVAKVREYDKDLGYVSSGWLDFPLPAPNKGLEGLTCVRRDGELYLLGLCEGNRCRRGAAGRRPGGGRIHVFAEGEKDWEHVDTIRLPASLWFEDFSSLAINRDQLCVVSQESSALWLGTLAPSAWEVVDDGEAFVFPTDADGRTVYCTVEGVAWLFDDQVVVVSDRAKPGEQGSRCRAKDQSVHVFAIP